MKNKFYQYFFNNLCLLIGILWLLVLILFASLAYSIENSLSFTFWELLHVVALAVVPFIGCFSLGSYWLLRKVVINYEGIEIYFFRKSIRKIDWNTILSIEKTSHMKNPALKIELQNAEVIYLDNRKAIRKAIEFYSDRTFFE